MAEIVTIARPYAEAVFRLAREQGRLAGWSETLEKLAGLAARPDVAALIVHPNVAAGQLTELFQATVAAGADGETGNFIRMLADNDRLAALPQVAALYEEMKRGEEGVKEAEIVSAFPLNEEQVATLARQLEGHFQAKLDVTVTVDPSLIGGIKVVVGDKVLDASVRSKLDAMRTALNS
jgi:F-type H+-transporting ATPase subunit delta